jgi:hypothetical protein
LGYSDLDKNLSKENLIKLLLFPTTGNNVFVKELMPSREYNRPLGLSARDNKYRLLLRFHYHDQWRTEGGGGVWGVQTPPPGLAKF